MTGRPQVRDASSIYKGDRNSLKNLVSKYTSTLCENRRRKNKEYSNAAWKIIRPVAKASADRIADTANVCTEQKVHKSELNPNACPFFPTKGPDGSSLLYPGAVSVDDTQEAHLNLEQHELARPKLVRQKPKGRRHIRFDDDVSDDEDTANEIFADTVTHWTNIQMTADDLE